MEFVKNGKPYHFLKIPYSGNSIQRRDKGQAKYVHYIKVLFHILYYNWTRKIVCDTKDFVIKRSVNSSFNWNWGW